VQREESHRSIALKIFKAFVIFGFPLFGILYFYQFTGQDRDVAVPFQVFRVPEKKVLTGEGKEAELLFAKPVTIVSFWATWCPPCVEEFPAMVELQRQLEDKGVEILFVSVDDSWAAVQSFMMNNRIEVKPGRLFWDRDKKIAATWGSTKFPETYVVRRDGWVVEKVIGAQQWTLPRVLSYFEDLGRRFEKISLQASSR
jgi:cytochrome c biogenesis protein CcmG/thiol:disulfide interchange protein DsbE